jgi:Zn-dependent peptidase ImmA (M78 family)/transcriptional regulator with XRE-family HTH domain
MIVLARESRGMTQKELAAELKIDQGHLSKVENGLVGVSDELIEKLSKVLRYPNNFFCEIFRIYAPGLPFYRKHKTLSHRDLSVIIATSNIRRNHVEKLLRSVETVNTLIPDLYADDMGSPEDIARAVRQYWRLPPGPVPDMTKAMEDAGVIVFDCQFDTRFFSGMSLPTQEVNYIVFINGTMPGDRMRFTLAHELGHILMHQIPTSNMEEEADRFASELLMPSFDIRSQLYKITLDRLATLKRYWKVSMAAILQQARRLNRITEHKYRSLWTEMGKAGYRLREPDELDIPQEKPSLISEVIDLHFTKLGYSREELSTFLGLIIDEFSALYTKPRNHLKVV